MKQYNVYKALVDLNAQGQVMELSVDDNLPNALNISLPSCNDFQVKMGELEMALDSIKKRLNPPKDKAA